jgi:hypothetical protein
VGKTFECADLRFAFGGNRLLFIRRARENVAPDCYLVAISNSQHGYFDPQMTGWKSEKAVAVAVSQFREKCEALLLMKPGDWIQTVLGIWQLNKVGERNSATLNLLAE